MAGRPLPIHTFFSFAAEPDLGSSRLSQAVADSVAVVAANAEDIPDVLAVFGVLSERGNLALGGMAPSTTEAKCAP